MKSHRRRFLIVAIYALAMAWVEAAVVFYLRTLVHRVVPFQPDPLPMENGLGAVELVREAATMIMLASVGFLAGTSARSRFGFFLAGFGIWDLFYYVFLRVMTGWPASVWDWDILFLIPLPWWGPVAAPCLIALFMIVFGLWMTAPPGESPALKLRASTWVLLLTGTFGALVIFMADALGSVANGQDAVLLRQLLPGQFPWPPFLLCLAMMAAPLWDAWWPARPRPFRWLARSAVPAE